jgi:selenide,water dikinase
MSTLPPASDPRLLVGSDTLDDAAVYRLSDDLALVQTVDFFTPVVDDPYDFGRIAAANAFSDVYAMGGRPLTALNIVCFPSGVLPLEYLSRILQGGAHTAALAGATIVGGHTIDDPEPKYGMAVTGLLRPGDETTNAAAVAGDLLVLTKPLGTGIVATAIKQGKASSAVIATATATMAELNRTGAEVAREHGVRAVTDVTGFGLLGHLSEMCRASGVGLDLWFDRLPLLPGAVELVQAGTAPGGTRRNLEFVEPWTAFDDALETWARLLCADAQTSGGLVLAVPEDRVEAVVAALRARGTAAAAIIGRVREQVEGGAGPLRAGAMMRVLATCDRGV